MVTYPYAFMTYIVSPLAGLAGAYCDGRPPTACYYYELYVSGFWSVALYAAEMRTLTQADGRLEAFEMWIWRRMEKLSWLDKVTNEEVLRRVNEDILNSAKETSMDWPYFETRQTFA